MSFEFHGGFVALGLLQEFGASKSQAESVCEAIIRHQDLGDSGSISSLGALIQLATVFGEFASVVAPFLHLYLHTRGTLGPICDTWCREPEKR
jgi:cyanamide hydratase family protein with HD domain